MLLGTCIGVAANSGSNNSKPLVATATATAAAVATPTAKPPTPTAAPPTPTAAPPTPLAPPPTSAPAALPPTAAPPPPTAAPRGCYPLTNSGNCYEPGEYCRNSDHGMTGVAGNGESIICRYNNGWRWEPA